MKLACCPTKVLSLLAKCGGDIRCEVVRRGFLGGMYGG